MKLCSIEGCDRRHYARGWCSKHYARWRKYGEPDYPVRGWHSDPETRFKDNTIPVTETGCLLWTGSVSDFGYGRMWVNSKNVGAHRYAWERENGAIPEGMLVDHKICHTPECVNVQHLRLATIQQNVQHRAGTNSNNTSGHRNVYWNKTTQKWVAHVSQTYFGQFEDIEEAAKVAEQARKELFGEFAGRG